MFTHKMQARCNNFGGEAVGGGGGGYWRITKNNNKTMRKKKKRDHKCGWCKYPSPPPPPPRIPGSNGSVMFPFGQNVFLHRTKFWRMALPKSLVLPLWPCLCTDTI